MNAGELPQEIRYTIDLKDNLVQQTMRGKLVKNDRAANKVVVVVVDGKEEVDLSGVAVTGGFVRPGDSAEILLNGSAEGNEASVTLEDACYEQAGTIEIFIRLSIGGTTRTILTLTGDVIPKGSGAYVDITGAIPSVEDVIAQYAEMKAVTQRTLSAAQRAENLVIGASGLAGDSNKLGGKLPSEYLQKSQVVNNFTTTEAGFVADARSVKMLNDGLGLRLKHARITYEAMSFAPGSQSVIPTTIPEGAPESGTVIAVILYAQYDNVFYQWNPQLLSGIRDVNTYSFAVNNLRGAAFSTNVRGVVLYSD